MYCVMYLYIICHVVKYYLSCTSLNYPTFPTASRARPDPPPSLQRREPPLVGHHYRVVVQLLHTRTIGTMKLVMVVVRVTFAARTVLLVKKADLQLPLLLNQIQVL